MLMPQHSEREDTTTWTAPVKAEEEKEKMNTKLVSILFFPLF